jgi:hypothetical protein
MALTRADRERVSDSRLKIRSASGKLSDVDRPQENIPDFEEIQRCLENVERSLDGALRENELDDGGR